MPTLTFPLASLPPMVAGGKSATVRTDRRLAGLRPGDPVTLNFGARNNPTVRRATVTRLEVLDLRPLLERLRKADEDALALVAELVSDGQAGRDGNGERPFPAAPPEEWPDVLEELGATPALARALAEACRDSLNAPGDLLLQANETGEAVLVAVWVRLKD